MSTFFDSNSNSWSVFIDGTEIVLPYSVEGLDPHIGKHAIYYFNTEGDILMLKYGTFFPIPVFRGIKHLIEESWKPFSQKRSWIHLCNIVESNSMDRTVILTYDSVYDFNGDLIISGLKSTSGIRPINKQIQCMNDRMLIVSGDGTNPNKYDHKCHLRHANVYVIDLLHKKVVMSSINLETFIEYDNRDVYENRDRNIKRIGEILRRMIGPCDETRFRIMSDNAFLFNHVLIKLTDDGVPSPVICLKCGEVTQNYMYYVETAREGLRTCCKKCHDASYVREGFEQSLHFS